MKIYLSILLAATSFFMMSCVNGSSVNSANGVEQDSALVTATNNPSSLAIFKIINPLVEKYPNYKENSIARESLEKEITQVLKQQIGKPSDILEGLPLEFSQVARNGSIEGVAEFTSPYAPISDKWDASITVYCTMNLDEASKLKSGQYTVRGKIQDWKPNKSYSQLSLGEFLIIDAQVTPYTY